MSETKNESLSLKKDNSDTPQMEKEALEQEKIPRKKQTSKFETLLHLIKANVGPGILALPKAMSNAGLMVGTIGLILLGMICIYCMHVVVKCSTILISKLTLEQKKNSKNIGGDTPASLDYADTADLAFRFGPHKWRKMAPYMRFTVNLMLVLTQFGFCCVYFIFIAESLHEVAKRVGILPSLSVFDIMLIELPVIIVLNFIPNLSSLTGVTSTAIILHALGLVMMFWYFLTGEKSNSIMPFIAPLDRLPLYFGTAMYSFEGIGVVLPLENDMKNKKDFRGWTGILNVGMCIVAILFTSVSVAGYVKYGSNVQPSITFNLPVGYVSEVIRLMFALATFLTYPLQMYVPFSFTLPYLKEKLIPVSLKTWMKCAIECFIRALFVFLTFSIASAVPMLDLVISFIGAFASSGLALILPPIIHILTIWESDIRHKKLIIGINIFICLFGVFGLLVGSGTAILEMWKKFHVHSTNATSHLQNTSFITSTGNLS